MRAGQPAFAWGGSAMIVVMNRFARLVLMSTASSLSLFAACNTNHELVASDYDQTCQQDSDCVAIFQGELGCCGGGCPNAAISRANYGKYQMDVASRQQRCDPAPPCIGVTCFPCSAACVAGRCAIAGCASEECDGGADTCDAASE